MIELSSRQSLMVFRMMDREGQAIGEIIQPKAAPVVGRGAGTVLLVRENRGSE